MTPEERYGLAFSVVDAIVSRDGGIPVDQALAQLRWAEQLLEGAIEGGRRYLATAGALDAEAAAELGRALLGQLHGAAFSIALVGLSLFATLRGAEGVNVAELRERLGVSIN